MAAAGFVDTDLGSFDGIGDFHGETEVHPRASLVASARTFGAQCRTVWSVHPRRAPEPEVDRGLHPCLDRHGWLDVAAIIALFARRVVGWSMKTDMTAP
jgi:transposase InsO family protein